ncbi:MAG TPA: hydantoinase B/oxoprolinase family protein, partial [Stellaceae bacterium]|nr:hydantoinase B/oxoprolinase family protein [Stellaceae bacterium]
PTVIDAVIRAFEAALPDRVAGGHFGTFAVLRLQGKRLGGAHLDFIDGGYGGWGAVSGQDGSGPYRTMAHGDTRVVPIELQEAMYPFVVEDFALRPDSGGAGQFRGGLGITKTYRITEPVKLRVDFDRLRCPPWGVCGGRDAQSGWVTVIKPSGESKILHKTKAHPVQPGDIVRMEVGGGGGFGPPEARDRAAIERDLALGYVSPEAVRTQYGLDL